MGRQELALSPPASLWRVLGQVRGSGCVRLIREAPINPVRQMGTQGLAQMLGPSCQTALHFCPLRDWAPTLGLLGA